MCHTVAHPKGVRSLPNGAKAVRAVERTLDILDLFLDWPAPLGPSEVARLTQIPKSTVYRHLLALEARGYLRRASEKEWFVLGPRLAGVAWQKRSGDLRETAQSIIEGLRDTCGETVGLHQLEGDERVCIGAAESAQALRTSGRVGTRAPLYSGASAKVIMAFLPEQQWEEVIARTGLAPLTPRTITDPVRLRAELGRIRSEGFAISYGEWDEGITSVAAPIFGTGGQVVGSINISGPSFRLDPDRIQMMVGALRAAAQMISQRLQESDGGHRG